MAEQGENPKASVEETPKTVNTQQDVPPSASTVDDLKISQVYSVEAVQKNTGEIDSAVIQAVSTATAAQEQAESQPAVVTDQRAKDQATEAHEPRAIVVVEEEIHGDETQQMDDQEMDYSDDDEEEVEEDEEEPSMHMCGRCKITFTDLATFIQHRAKKTCKKVARTPSPKKAPRKEKGAVAESLDHTETVLTTEQPVLVTDDETQHDEADSQSVVVSSVSSLLSQSDVLSLSTVSGNPTAIVVPAGTLHPHGSAIIIPPKLEPGTVVVLSEGSCPEPSTSPIPAAPPSPTTVPPKKAGKRGRASRKQESPQKKAKGAAAAAATATSPTSASQLTVKIVKQPVVAPFTFKCNKCEARFPTKDACKLHQGSHERIHKCSKCSKKYFTLQSLKHHTDTYVHENPCDVCSKVFPSKAHLKKHKLTHSTDQTFTCDICKKEFNVEHNFKSHMRYVHPEKKNHKCEKCGKEFSRKDKLKRHMITHDPNSPRLPCPFKGHTGCEKTFARPDKLKRHLFTHSKEKPFKCEHCGRVFARKDNLTDHVRLHTGIYNYYCKVCGKGMSGPSKLRKHIQSEHPGFTDLDEISPSMVVEGGKPLVKPNVIEPSATITKPTETTTTNNNAVQDVAMAAVPAQPTPKEEVAPAAMPIEGKEAVPEAKGPEERTVEKEKVPAPVSTGMKRLTSPTLPHEEKDAVSVAVALANVAPSANISSPPPVSSPSPTTAPPTTTISIAMQPLTQQVMQSMPAHVPDAMSSLVAAAISSQLPPPASQPTQPMHSPTLVVHHPTTLPSPTTTVAQGQAQPVKSPIMNSSMCMPGTTYTQVPTSTPMSSMNMMQQQTQPSHIAAVSQALQTHMQKNMNPGLINQMSNAVVCMPLLTTASVIRPSYPVMPPDSMTCAIQSAVAAAAAAYRQSQQQREEMGSDESESEDEQQISTTPMSVNPSYQQTSTGYPQQSFPVQIPPPPLLHHRSLLNQPFTPPPVTSQMGTSPRVTVIPNDFPYQKQF